MNTEEDQKKLNIWPPTHIHIPLNFFFSKNSEFVHLDRRMLYASLTQYPLSPEAYLGKGSAVQASKAEDLLGKDHLFFKGNFKEEVGLCCLEILCGCDNCDTVYLGHRCHLGTDVKMKPTLRKGESPGEQQGNKAGGLDQRAPLMQRLLVGLTEEPI